MSPADLLALDATTLSRRIAERRVSCRELMEASSFKRLMELSADGARRQAETAAAQMHELSDLARRVATETTEPLSASVARVLQQAA